MDGIEMSKRECGFLLIGFGAGLLLAVAAVIEFLLWFHHMFIVGIVWRPQLSLLVLPFLLIALGIAMIRHTRLRAENPK